MKVYGIFIVIIVMTFSSVNVKAQYYSSPKDTMFHYEIGDPRQHNDGFFRNVQKLIEEYESWREKPTYILEELGPDTDWEADVAKAKVSGGYVKEVSISNQEPIELCMIPADVSKVTHLKISGRAYQWQVYGPDDLGLEKFLQRMPNLKVLNLRDLDCEMYWISQLKKLEKIVLPANCQVTANFYNPNLKTIIYGSRLKAIGDAAYEKDFIKYNTVGMGSGFHTSAMTSVEFPEGIEYIAAIEFSDVCQKVVLPSTLKYIDCLGAYFMPGHVQHLKGMKEIHIKSSVPPLIGKTQLEYEHLKHITLYVPKGTKNAYMRDLKWRNFGDIVEEDVIVKNKLSNNELIQGKWYFVGEDLYDPNQLFKDRKPLNTIWINLNNGVWEECVKNGEKQSSGTRYEVQGRRFLLKVKAGVCPMVIEKLNENSLDLSITVNKPNMNYRVVYHYKREIDNK